MRLWVNHWFSQISDIIQLIKMNYNDVYIIGSSDYYRSNYSSICDEWHTEPPNMSDADYLHHSLAFCEEYNIDIFLPGPYHYHILRYSHLFRDIGVIVMADTLHWKVLQNKVKIYKMLGDNDMVPYYRVAKNSDKALKHVKKCFKEFGSCIIKKAIDIGGLSYCHLKDTSDCLKYDYSSPLIIMPYLTGPEVSADCMFTDNQLIILQREKLANSEVAVDYPVINSYCYYLWSKFDFEYPFNAQFRLSNGQFKLIDLNPRISGGIKKSFNLTGINLPCKAFEKAFNYWCVIHLLI